MSVRTYGKLFCFESLCFVDIRDSQRQSQTRSKSLPNVQKSSPRVSMRTANHRTQSPIAPQTAYRHDARGVDKCIGVDTFDETMVREEYLDRMEMITNKKNALQNKLNRVIHDKDDQIRQQQLQFAQGQYFLKYCWDMDTVV